MRHDAAKRQHAIIGKGNTTDAIFVFNGVERRNGLYKKNLAAAGIALEPNKGERKGTNDVSSRGIISVSLKGDAQGRVPTKGAQAAT